MVKLDQILIGIFVLHRKGRLYYRPKRTFFIDLSYSFMFSSYPVNAANGANWAALSDIGICCLFLDMWGGKLIIS